uniref:Uncharacterized protein n=1 Tax=Octopus bimaculoides TaxID=37653 RepID=A0A0L8HTJ1_OCTBM
MISFDKTLFLWPRITHGSCHTACFSCQQLQKMVVFDVEIDALADKHGSCCYLEGYTQPESLHLIQTAYDLCILQQEYEEKVCVCVCGRMYKHCNTEIYLTSVYHIQHA